MAKLPDMRFAKGMSFAWFRREDYARLLEVSDDRDNLPQTYDEWEKNVERKLALFKAEYKGPPIKKVIVDPDQLAAFCRSKGIKCDTQGRSTFAAFRAMQEGTGN